MFPFKFPRINVNGVVNKIVYFINSGMKQLMTLLITTENMIALKITLVFINLF